MTDQTKQRGDLRACTFLPEAKPGGRRVNSLWFFCYTTRGLQHSTKQYLEISRGRR